MCIYAYLGEFAYMFILIFPESETQSLSGYQ